MGSESVDQLLERYLQLLDRYTKLREELSQLHTSLFQNLARANFSAERGMRYGQDYYDERMQATRRVTIEISETGTSRFLMRPAVADSEEIEVTPDKKEEGEISPSDKTNDEAAADAVAMAKAKAKAKSDPLRWYGILTPTSLRQAQANAVKVVEDVVPQLMSVSSQMEDLEIQIRRARKRRAKSEASEAKKALKEPGIGGALSLQGEAAVI